MSHTHASIPQASLLTGSAYAKMRLHDRVESVLRFGCEFPMVDAATPRADRCTSRIYEIEADRLLKVCLVQSSPRNQLLRAIGLSRAQVEYQSNIDLRRLGLATPAITAVATVLNPFSRIDTMLLVDRVADAEEGIPYLNDERVPDSAKRDFIERVADGLERMLDTRFALRDFRLNNLLTSHRDPTPIWIDNDVKHGLCRAQAIAKLRTTARRVLHKDAPRIPGEFARLLHDRIAPMAGLA